MEIIISFLLGMLVVFGFIGFFSLNSEIQRYKYFKNLFTAITIVCFFANIGWGFYCVSHFLSSETPFDKNSIYKLVVGMSGFSTTFVLIPVLYLANKIIGSIKSTAEVIDDKL